jgi:antirestriction protein ArdC
MAKTQTRRRVRKSADGPRFDVYQAVTDKIVAALESGVVPWRKPWKSLGEGMQRNVTSKRAYRGVNQLLLGLSEFDSPWWITFKAASELGARVKPEQAKKHGGVGPELVVYWNRIACRACTDKDGHVTQPKCERCGNRRSFFILRFFTVWNVEQIDGLPDGLVPPPPELPDDYEPDDACEELLAPYAVPVGPPIAHRGDRAYYQPDADKVTMPRSGQFDSPDAYYAALFHELVHSTGHEKRLARPELCELRSTFGSEPYAREELTAEVGASMLCALAGVSTPELDDNAAAYIGNWLGKLKDDKKLIVGASAQAQRAVDLIVGATFEDAEPTNGSKEDV